MTAFRFSPKVIHHPGDIAVADSRGPCFDPVVMSAEPIPYVSVEDYLAGELRSEVRHEYFDGFVTAMAGTSDRHEIVAGNLFGALLNHLRGKPCRPFVSGMKLRLRVRERDLFYYPDIMVACQPTDNARYFREQPVLLGEVLSEDENKDLVEKYFAYQRIAALAEYIVLSQNPAQPEVQIFRRSEGWDEVETHRDPAAQFTLRSVGLTLTLGDLYVA